MADGRAILVRSPYLPSSLPDSLAAPIHLHLTEDQVGVIWRAVRENDFFSLRARYDNQKIMDGSQAEIGVVANGDTHVVRVRNVAPRRFVNVFSAVRRNLPEAYRKGLW
jgi:hypothetical protein